MAKQVQVLQDKDYEDKDYQDMDYQDRVEVVQDDRILPEQGRNVIKPYPNHMPRFEKGSSEAKAYVASIRNKKQGSVFFF
jgi:hypothetical protein